MENLPVFKKSEDKKGGTHLEIGTKKLLLIGLATFAMCFLTACGGNSSQDNSSSDDTTTPTVETPTQTEQAAPPVIPPAEGWTLHMSARNLFPGAPDMPVNKYCKSVVGDMTQCQIFDGNNSDSRLVGVETIVGPEMYNTFTPQEKKLWMPTKDLLQATSAAMPDVDAQQFTDFTNSLAPDYSKIYLLWDPGTLNMPTGNPVVTVMNKVQATGTTSTSPTPSTGATKPANNTTSPNSPNQPSAQPSPVTSVGNNGGFTMGVFDTAKIVAQGLTEKKGNFESTVLQRNNEGSLELYKLKNNIGLHTYTNTTQLIYIVSGKGEFTIGDRKQTVSGGAVVIIPAGAAQAFQNLGGTDSPLIFVTFKTPFDDTNVKWGA